MFTFESKIDICVIFQGEAGPFQSAELVAGAVKEITQSSKILTENMSR